MLKAKFSATKKREIARELLESRWKKERPIIVAPSAYDGVSAKLVEKLGFEMCGVSGYAVSASVLGMPDIGAITMTEMVEQCRNIANAVNIPVTCDGDTGYGNPMNVMRTIREFENAGVTGLFIEDQVTPKRCGSAPGKQLLPVEEFIQKIKAALEARDDPNFHIAARTDGECISTDEAIRRANIYYKAGADGIVVIPHSYHEWDPKWNPLDEISRYAKEIKAPLSIGMCGPLETRGTVTVKDYDKLGIVKTGIMSPIFAAIGGIKGILMEFKENGSPVGYWKKYKPPDREEVFDLLGMPEYRAYEKKYVTTYIEQLR